MFRTIFPSYLMSSLEYVYTGKELMYLWGHFLSLVWQEPEALSFNLVWSVDISIPHFLLSSHNDYNKYMVGQIGKPKSLPAVKKNELIRICFSKWIPQSMHVEYSGGRGGNFSGLIENIQLTPGQYWLEECGSTYMWIFIFSKSAYCNTTQTIGNYRTEGQL